MFKSILKERGENGLVNLEVFSNLSDSMKGIQQITTVCEETWEYEHCA